MSTTNTKAPITQLATSTLLWIGKRKGHERHAEAVTEMRRRLAKTKRANTVAKLGKFLAAYDGVEVASEPTPVKAKIADKPSKSSARKASTKARKATKTVPYMVDAAGNEWIAV